jgi:DNA recombination protein RmuC
MDWLLDVLWLLLGLAGGGGVAWLVMRASASAAYQRGRLEGEALLATLNERLDGRQQTINDQAVRLGELSAKCEEATNVEAVLRERVAHLNTTLDQERKQGEEKLAVINQAQLKLTDAFKALASDALQGNNDTFLKLAKTAFDGLKESAQSDLDKRQQAIVELVKPVRESLEKVDGKINELEKARAGAYQGLTEQVKSLLDSQKDLRSETSNLVQALRKPQVRGRWGEIQLRRVVEMAGMLDHCDFYEQQTATTDDGRLRPDLLVRLPGNKNVVVDAKAPLSAYLDAIEAPDEATRTARLVDHARQVRTHISALGKKAYFEQFDPAPEFVILFLPGEVFFSAALEFDPQLIECGVEQNVIVATPTTLIALLRAVSYGWRQEQLARNAKEISDLGRDLYKRLSTLGGYVAAMGKHLAGATEAYNKVVGSLESRVLTSARKFKELGASGNDDDIDDIAPVEVTPRVLQAPEYAGPEKVEEV